MQQIIRLGGKDNDEQSCWYWEDDYDNDNDILARPGQRAFAQMHKIVCYLTVNLTSPKILFKAAAPSILYDDGGNAESAETTKCKTSAFWWGTEDHSERISCSLWQFVTLKNPPQNPSSVSSKVSLFLIPNAHGLLRRAELQQQPLCYSHL